MNIDQKIDRIFEAVDQALVDGRVDEAIQFVSNEPILDLCADVLVALLTAAWWIPDWVGYRDLRSRISDRLTEIMPYGTDVEAILQGL